MYRQAGLAPLMKASGLARNAVSSASRNAIAAIGKKARSAATPAVKVSSLKVALVEGISIVIKGEGIDLDQAIESLSVALKEMKKAVADGLDGAFVPCAPPTAEPWPFAVRSRAASARRPNT